MTRTGSASNPDDIERASYVITFQAEDQLKQGIGTTVAYFDDPDGTHLEIIQPQGPFQRRGA